MWLYACCGLLCPAYPQHFVHGSVDKIPGYPGRAGTLTGLHPMQVCRCRRPPHPVTFRRSSSTRCGFGAAPAFVCGRPVIVERRSFSIVAAVELDDASHLRPERRRRDILLEEVLRQAGIPLLRSHDARKLLQMTGEWLNTTGADQLSPEHRS